MLVWAQIAGVSRPGIEILVDRRSRHFDFNPNVDPLAGVITVEARSNDAGAHHRWNEYQGTETRQQPNLQPMHRQDRLLLDALDRYEAHARPAHRLADRFGIGDIVFVRLHVRLHKLRRHQTHRMSKAVQRACPVMRTRAGLHTNHARRQISKKYCHLRAPQLFAKHRLTPFIDPMHLEQSHDCPNGATSTSSRIRSMHHGCQDKRRFFSDARATPPPISGLMTSSSTVTLESST